MERKDYDGQPYILPSRVLKFDFDQTFAKPAYSDPEKQMVVFSNEAGLTSEYSLAACRKMCENSDATNLQKYGIPLEEARAADVLADYETLTAPPIEVLDPNGGVA